ncbi:DedA family protein [Aneurinibacillus sp. Ricciae_BoGa-3]|uniref:DedA family protein n=1 Tax=Aneurinibacillus sp. Ricciae_BoGa-3 TaxID=3022697 RepID=UPI00233FBA4A|nr:DedA family protein [Aneurinibacillus sp. Ricciae_BoGa-3]WCK56519.1 DedA family protein [Aneurinibacillus sp. Ricciae_BoGa-3]
MHLLEALSTFVMNLIQALGHTGIFIAMLIESACIPLPSEVVMLFGGFLVAKGSLTFWGVALAGILGNLVGSILTYWVAIYVGVPLIKRYGRYILVNPEHIDKAEQWFRRYGDWAVFFGRILPVIRTFISLPAGIARMNFTKFVLFTALGCIPWNIGLTYLGVKLGDHWHSVEPYFKPVSYLILLIVVIFVIRFVYKNMRKTTA